MKAFKMIDQVDIFSPGVSGKCILFIHRHLKKYYFSFLDH